MKHTAAIRLWMGNGSGNELNLTPYRGKRQESTGRDNYSIISLHRKTEKKKEEKNAHTLTTYKNALLDFLYGDG